MFTLDTNILIYYSKGDSDVIKFLNENSSKIFYLPTITVVEFMSYPLIEPEAISLFRLFAAETMSVGLDLLLAEKAAEIRRSYGLKLADSVIAATTIFTNSTLVTRNTRDFKKISGLRLLKI